jgi:ABC-2 type transport system permease protein
MELRTILAYRSSFWINFFGTSLGQLGISYFLWSAIFLKSNGKLIGGMNFQMMILYSLLAPMTIKTVMGLTMLDINQDIYTGGLNKFIIYPINYFHFKWVQQMTQSLSRLLQLFVALGIYGVIVKMPIGFHFKTYNVLLFIINIFVSSSLFFVMEALMEVAAFWAENVWSLSVLLRFLINFLSGAWLSLSLFPSWSEPILAILPFRGLVYTPVKMLMGEVGFYAWLQVQLVSITWIIILGLIFSLVWKKGRMLYSGVGI